MQRSAAFAAAGVLLLAAAGPAQAHSAICNCYDNGDGTITCEGGFSDGSSAEGVPVRVVDDRERVLVNGAMDAAGTFSFDRPDGDFHVVFDAGQGHAVTVYGMDIEE
jgi:hypothetical protein